MAVAGEKIANLEEVVEKFSFLIRSAIRKTSPQIEKSDMDDIEQEVRIKIWKEIQKSEKVIHNLGSYMWRITYTTTSKIMRKVSKQEKRFISRREEAKDREYETPSPKPCSPDYQFEKKELMEIVQQAVNSLIESRRQVIKLYLTGMDVGEITEFFGWSDGKARNLLSRGLSDLREILQEKGIEFE